MKPLLKSIGITIKLGQEKSTIILDDSTIKMFKVIPPGINPSESTDNHQDCIVSKEPKVPLKQEIQCTKGTVSAICDNLQQLPKAIDHDIPKLTF